MKPDYLKFVIVGHVDHGKSTLIGRLLYETDSLPPEKIEEVKKASSSSGKETEFAYLLDQFKEEREQGITIDTTQVSFERGKRQYVIIDAPGHVEFVRNMITGASQAEAAVLIIDIVEGVKEQTRRHAYLLSLLGIKQVIVALNKMDLVGFGKESFDGVVESVRELLDFLNITPISCIPISAKGGDNIVRKSENTRWYRGPTFLESLDMLEPGRACEDKPLLFPVQDVYRVGEMRLAVGRIETGFIQAGCRIKVLPGGVMTKVNSVEKYLEKKKKAQAGESIGISLQDSTSIKRGDVVCLPGKEPVLTRRFSGNIFWMLDEPLIEKQKLSIRCATQETDCEIEKIERITNSSTLEPVERELKRLENLEVGKINVMTEKPLAIKAFADVRELGRFVLTRKGNICAGGIITGSEH